MRRRNKLFDTWRFQVEVRINKQLVEWFGEPSTSDGYYQVVLRVDEAPFPEEFLPKEPISWKAFENVVLPQAYDLDIGSVYLDITDELKKRIFDTHPDKHAVTVTLRKMGISVEQYFLERVYNLVRVHIDLGKLLDTLDITIIPEFEDVHIKTRDPAGGYQEFDEELVRTMYSRAVTRLVNVFIEQKDVEPIWIRPVKGNTRERVIVKFKDNMFEMYYKSFPDYCCNCVVAHNETVQRAMSEYAKVFINAVYKHYWPEVTAYLERLK